MQLAQKYITAGLANRVPKLPLSMKLVVLTLFLPEQLSIFIAGLRLSEVRIIFLLLAPLAFLRFSRKRLTGRYRFIASDLFVPLAGLWMFVGPAIVNGLADSLQHSGPIVLEYLIAYMATRVLLADKEHSLAFVNMLCLAIAIVALDGVVDAVTGDFFTRDLVTRLTGAPAHEWAGGADTYRFGMRRAVGPLEHPILFGFVCAIGLLFAMSVRIRLRVFCIFSCLAGVIVSGSTAPMQVVLMGSALFVYSKMFGTRANKWVLLWTAIAIGVAGIFMSTPTPFGHLIELFTIDPSTAYYRLFIWRSVGPAILQNPYFTVLEGEYDYSGSVDSVWLVLSLQYGMVCAIFTALSMFGSCSRPTNGGGTSLTENEKVIARTTSILILLTIFMGLTVHLWGSSWVLAGLLVGLRANLGEAAVLKAREEVKVSRARWNNSAVRPQGIGSDLHATSSGSPQQTPAS
ncbi:MAG: O-antigen ligase family protein [Rhodomicrobium sp.]